MDDRRAAKVTIVQVDASQKSITLLLLSTNKMLKKSFQQKVGE
jgi:hypothetical protein